MLKHKSQQIEWLIRFGDIFIAVAAFFSAYAFRQSTWMTWNYSMGQVENFLWLLGLSIGLHFFIYESFKFYTSIRMKPVGQLVGDIFKAFFLEFVTLGSLVFLLQQKETSRAFFVIYLFLNYGLILAQRLGAKLVLSNVRQRGYNYRQILIVGQGAHADKVRAAIESRPHWGYKIVTQVGESLDSSGNFDLSQIQQVFGQQAVDEVYLALESVDSKKYFSISQMCEDRGIPLRLSLAFFDQPTLKIETLQLDHLPVISFYNTKLMSPLEEFIKRSLDIGIAIVGLIITAILFPWIALRIKSQSPGKLIYKGLRIGENGRKFKCYKFRTMKEGADLEKAKLFAANELSGPVFKIQNDPRVFPFGAFLRRTSLDEFPQFFNVLRGDMSIVGTRPPTPDEVAEYKDHYRRRLSIKPGITGLWQVSGRNQIKNFEDILALDLHYIDHWNIGLDLWIILKTVWVVLARRGSA